MKMPILIGVLVVILAAGAATGFGLSKLINGSSPSANNPGAPGTITQDQVAVGKVYGSEDTKKFPDISEGIIQAGGLDGEGTHHLVRAGGSTQTVYLTSSSIDLDLFVDDKVQVHGQTFSAQKAAWFMDVGSVKVIELNAQKPAGSDTTTIPKE